MSKIEETSKALPCVAVTDDYNLFKNMEGNRVIKQSHVKKLITSFKENGQIPVPIIVNEQMVVIDGHHRLDALKQMSLPIYYLVVEGLDLQDVITLNHDQVKWNLKDFVGSWAKRGNEDYKQFVDLLDAYPKFSVHMLYAVVKGKSGMAGNEVSHEVEKGALTIDVPLEDVNTICSAWAIQLEWLRQNKASMKNEVKFSLLKLIKDGHDAGLFFEALTEGEDKSRNAFIGYLQRTDGYSTIYNYILKKINEKAAVAA